MRQEFRDRTGMLRGWSEQAGNRTNARDRTGNLVGWFDPACDETRDRTGRLFGKGNFLVVLIMSA